MSLLHINVSLIILLSLLVCLWPDLVICDEQHETFPIPLKHIPVNEHIKEVLLLFFVN